VSEDNPFLAAEKMASAAITASLDICRDLRDTWAEGLFNLIYGPAGLGILFPPPPAVRVRGLPRVAAPEEDGLYEVGDALTAVLRIVAAAVVDTGVFDRRSARVFAALREQTKYKDVPPAEIRRQFRLQARLVRQDRERALDALPALLPTNGVRRRVVEVVRRMATAARDAVRVDHALAARVAQVLELDVHEPPFVPAGVQQRAGARRPAGARIDRSSRAAAQAEYRRRACGWGHGAAGSVCSPMPRNVFSGLLGRAERSAAPSDKRRQQENTHDDDSSHGAHRQAAARCLRRAPPALRSAGAGRDGHRLPVRAHRPDRRGRSGRGEADHADPGRPAADHRAGGA
jgi:hypothetical protein